jgi:16S rRNA (guanine966-N2)-methyltransferase
MQTATRAGDASRAWREAPVRVTGGRLAGRRFRAPRGAAVRPTADRVRESLFASLPSLEGARVLDLYAGSGALGIEALSRGAAHAVFVERARAAAACLEANLDALGLRGASRVVRADVRATLGRLAREAGRFDLILADPPYGDPRLGAVLRALAAAELLAPEGTLVLETSWRHPPGDALGLGPVGERRYGETLVRFYERAAGRGAREGEAE